MLLPMVCGSPNWDYSGRKAFKDFFIFRRTNTDFFLRIINKLILKQTNKRNNQSPAANFNTDGDVPPRGAVHAQKSWPHCSSGRKDRRSCRIHTMGAEQEWPCSAHSLQPAGLGAPLDIVKPALPLLPAFSCFSAREEEHTCKHNHIKLW